VQFHDEEERLFRAARHGDVAAIERSLASGGNVHAAAPIDGKTALFRAAVFGHVDAVRALLRHGADASIRGHDGRTALEMVVEARTGETDRARAQALDAVAAALREANATP
jgi:ankyrin repeat protein